ncbi:DUF5359 family protein [Pseudalkalibacillus caeni]|uniref:YpfB family protein n=1 Tax=Exobacillus caeni TaxID=2574798 RepID=A0A5R9F0K6_9BACL|nr:DUF5359 family protein [Pseudalkalibacillus caeni]TLS35940.1 hypothetical protein FCL54_18275 [Pseudalkalibacillus caeni]
MKKVESLIIKLLWIHFAFLVIAQFLLSYDAWEAKLNKTIYYEGVYNLKQSEPLETIDPTP